MAPTQPSLSSTDDKKPKLPRIGNNQRIQKRPLMHPAIASPRSSSEKVVYVSPQSSFIAIVKRVRRYLDGAEFRAGPTILPTTDRELMREIEEGIKNARMGKRAGNGNDGEVVMKGTGKAIEKTLALANWWRKQEGVRVVLRTKSIATVDDIVGVSGEDVDEDMKEDDSRVRRVRMDRLDINTVGGITTIETANTSQRDVNVLFRASPIGGQIITIKTLRIAMESLSREAIGVLDEEIRFHASIDHAAFQEMLHVIDPHRSIYRFITTVREVYRLHNHVIIRIAFRLKALQQRIAALSRPVTREEVEDWAKAQHTAYSIHYYLSKMPSVNGNELRAIRNSI
ncbi:hypothetical protein EYC80_000858 [Monilinia laxa]|uniref:Uncharacterized protein n=1 Tax=Monilinia laxa TaxID=61186 RepID=A0A5N6K887_MONLA|nr:hypothetical protein EYC80_000858 [Monilinia laxa]